MANVPMNRGIPTTRQYNSPLRRRKDFAIEQSTGRHQLCATPLSSVSLLGWKFPKTTAIAPISYLAAFAVLVFGILKQNKLAAVRSAVKRRLWPMSEADPSFSEPLPPGSLGCPFVGFNILQGNSKGGPEPFYYQQSKRLGHVPLWKFYFLGRPCVNLTGAAMIQKVFGREFDGTIGAAPGTKEYIAKKRNKPSIVTSDSLAFERDKEQHAFLRRLVGAGIQNAKPFEMLKQAAQDCINAAASNDKNDVVVMHDMAMDYTLEFVEKKLLGITSRSNRDKVREMLKSWMDGINSLLLAMTIPFINRRSKPYKARLYLQQKIDEKIHQLEKRGRSDGSILASMLFAVDDDNDAGELHNNANKDNSTKKKLTRSQVVGNALFLVAAGTETTASTLTLAIFLLGLHPECYEKLVEEQTSQFQTQALTEDQLAQESSPYLDAVIKETMRIGPITGGFPRRVQNTITINGLQIPKDWELFGSIRLTHQLDPTTWEPNQAHMNPQTGFQPERWLDEDRRPRDFVPFGAGQRFCLGSSLATLELKVFLATWARSIPFYKLELPKTQQDAGYTIKWNPRSIIPRPADGVKVRFRENCNAGKDNNRG